MKMKFVQSIWLICTVITFFVFVGALKNFSNDYINQDSDHTKSGSSKNDKKKLQDKDKELQDEDKIASPESPPLPNTPLQINTSIDSTEPIAVLVMACNRVSVSKCIDTLLRYVHVCSGFIYRKFS